MNNKCDKDGPATAGRKRHPHTQKIRVSFYFTLLSKLMLGVSKSVISSVYLNKTFAFEHVPMKYCNAIAMSVKLILK